MRGGGGVADDEGGLLGSATTILVHVLSAHMCVCMFIYVCVFGGAHLSGRKGRAALLGKHERLGKGRGCADCRRAGSVFVC